MASRGGQVGRGRGRRQAPVGLPRRSSLAGFSLTLSVMTVCLGQVSEKVPQRHSRQVAPDDGPESGRISGVWSVWGSWSACSQPCGLGILERTRSCQPPYQQVPWAGRRPPGPHPAFPQQPPYQEERAANPYLARPAFPLHADRDVRPALSFHGGGSVLPLHSQRQPPVAPYSPQNRYSRHEEEASLAQLPESAASTRQDPAPSRAVIQPRRPQGNPPARGRPPSRAASQRPSRWDVLGAERTPSRHGGSARSPLRDSVPLFKPLRRDGLEGGLGASRPHHGSQADGSRFRWAASPTQETPDSRRSRVRESIKPGKYGYGKVPFALPLHTDAAGAAAEGAASRSKRHHSDQEGRLPPPPPPPPLPQARKQKPKARRSSHGEPDGWEEELLTAGGDLRPVRNPKTLPEVGNPSQVEGPAGALAGKVGALPGAQEGHLDESGYAPHPGVQGADSLSTDPAAARGAISRVTEEGKPREETLLLTTTTPETRNGAQRPRPAEGARQLPHFPVASANGVDIVVSEKSEIRDSVPAGTKAEGTDGHPPFPDSHRPAPGQGELRLRQTGAAPEWRGKSHRATAEPPPRSDSSSRSLSARVEHPHRPPHGHARPRSQRQNEHRTGGRESRPPHNLYVDRPAVPRPLEPDIWQLHRDSPVQFYARGHGPQSSPQPGAEGSQWNLYSPGTETFHCEGESKQFKACQQEPCPPDRPDPRAIQCTAYNSQEFMGRFYQWEPFRDVRGAQRCELNCRPIGYRFYVRHTEKVQDGTPCEAGSSDICVAGHCLTPGCDGILASNRTLDSCGVCGGDHTTCKLVVGNFSDTDVPIGYHRIMEIPAGATRILVKEMTRSPNYLALRSHGGKSIINGNWAVNPPGRYEAAGTVFVYSRPESDKQEGESLTAEGPTTEPLDVYMIFQQDNPGVSYQFFVALERPESSAADIHAPPQGIGPLQTHNFVPAQLPIPASQSGRSRVVVPPPVSSGQSGRSRVVVPPPVSSGQSGRSHAVVPPPVLSSQSGRSHAVVPPPVSSGQSGGSHAIVPPRVSPGQSGRSPGTLQRNVRIPPMPPPPPPLQHSSELARDFYWKRVGNTECSATCGKGSWQAVYRCTSRALQEEAAEEMCQLLPKPAVSEEACNMEPCPAYWDVGEWSACSKSCGLGSQHRQVLCRQVYANRSTMVHPQRCEQLEKPNATQECQVQLCSHWEVRTNWSSCSVLCGLGHRTRHVRCVSNEGYLLRDSDCPGNPRPKTSEACDMGPCVRTWFYSDWSSTCSAECGPGIQRRAVVCLSSNANEPTEENCVGAKPADMRSCNGGPCQRVTRWYSGPWSPCSADCGTGTQRRDVICVSKLGSDFNVTDGSECSHLERPPSLQSCTGSACKARWFSTAWGACSRTCVGGVQVREVQCLTQNKTLSQLCPPELKPAKKRSCNHQPCIPDLDENCRDKYHNCPVIVQARLCVYSYYKAVCCASCTHALERRHAGPSR
ncbi:ADAMTS-like protein 4 isoform X2 [Paroedura picta]|uniref:ADAMTS-like protein 4 isoform X2 n=1 Tax=Paroedura picta TaxID=143630 RepID=UPI0040560422